jgi:hypothetical protein
METRTLTATDPVTGQTVTRRTARTYHAAVVWTAADGTLHAHAWCGRPDLAAAALIRMQRAGVSDARLAPVTGDPWAAQAEPVAPARPRVNATAAPAPVSLAGLAADMGRSLGLAGAGHLPAARRRPVLPGELTPPPAAPAGGPGPELPALPTRFAGGGFAGREPWDPGTPDARARVALQGERVATLWPIAQALTGAGVTLPPSWAPDGPVMAGEFPYADALARLPLGAIAQAAAALAALPPVTAAQARALTLCRGGAV